MFFSIPNSVLCELTGERFAGDVSTENHASTPFANPLGFLVDRDEKKGTYLQILQPNLWK